MPIAPRIAAACGRRVPQGPDGLLTLGPDSLAVPSPARAGLTREAAPAADGGPLPELPMDIWERVFSHLPAATLARLPAGERVYRDALRETFGIEDAAMGPAPRRTLAAVCGLTQARRLEVSEVPMPPPPDWVQHPPRTDEEIIAAINRAPAEPFHPPQWGKAHGTLATWGTKVAFVVENTPTWHQVLEDATNHAGVAVLDVTTQTWTQHYNVGAHAIALGPEGVFATGKGRLSLLTWAGERAWTVDAYVHLAHLALGRGLVGGVTDDGTAVWWERGTGTYVGYAEAPAERTWMQQFVRVADGFAGGTHDGRILVWGDEDLLEPPQTLRENVGGSSGPSGDEDAAAHVIGLRSGGCGVVSANLPSGIRWRPRLGAPQASAQIWPEHSASPGTLQQVGSAVFWTTLHGVAEPLDDDREYLMRADRRTGAVERITDAVSMNWTSVTCSGAYYIFNWHRRALLRIAARQE